MVFIMKIFVDGGCRKNGHSSAIGAAAAVRMNKYGKHTRRTIRLYNSYSHRPTNQRAEISAIITGLRLALEKYGELYDCPTLRVTIHSDSKYAVNIMNEWIYKWIENGWTSARGHEVVNRDLIEIASSLDDELEQLGLVEYVWIPRSKNSLADQYCNDELDDMEAEGY